ncbi:MAG: Eco57I restriction-modification methylase domain-containing protein, partial [Acetobacteraceae bacterium]
MGEAADLYTAAFLLPKAGAPNAAARGRMIAALADAPPGSRDRALFAEFEAVKRLAEASSVLARESGRFPLTGRGDVNTYALFAELFSSLVSPRGRAGMLVPTGLITDYTTSTFFASLIDQNRLARLIDFENREGIFPAIDSRIKFSLLTIGDGAQTAEFAFFLTDTAQWADPRRRFMLSPATIARINPNTKTAPVFRSRTDAELTARIYSRVPILLDEAKGPAGNPWGVSFATMFHMSNDSALFRTPAQLRAAGFNRNGPDWIHAALVGRMSESEIRRREAHAATLRYVPLYEANMIHQFDHRWATYDGSSTRDVTADEKPDPTFGPQPRY